VFFGIHTPGVSVARLGDRCFEFDGGRIVALTEEWSSFRRSAHGPSGYSSYKGEVIPVYDLGRLAGSSDCNGAQLAILETTGGYIAILADGIQPTFRGPTAVIDVHALLANG